MGFDDNTNGMLADYDVSGVWLVMEMQFTEDCNETILDPCNRLANEHARFAFDNYSKVDDLSGIRVVIGDQPFYQYIEPSDIKFRKSLTIDAWRKELFLEK
jgi:hypothetical protein